MNAKSFKEFLQRVLNKDFSCTVDLIRDPISDIYKVYIDLPASNGYAVRTISGYELSSITSVMKFVNGLDIPKIQFDADLNKLLTED